MYKKLLALFVFFFFLSALLTYPSILHLTDKLIGDGGDNYQFFSFQYISSENIKHLRYPFSHTDIFRYPVGFNFESGFDSVLGVLTGSLASFLLSNVPAYNLTILFLFSLNGFFSFLLFRYISKSYFLGIIGAILYGYSFFAIAKSAGHLNLLFIGGLPLLVYAFLKTVDTFTTRNILLAFTAATLILLGSFQYSLLFSLSLLVVLPFLMLFSPRPLKSIALNVTKYIYKVLLISLPFFIITMVFSFPHLHAFLTGNFFKPDRSGIVDMLNNSPSIKDFLLPNAYLPLQITELTRNLNDSFKSIDRVVFIGWIELILFLLFIVLYKNHRLKYFIVSLTLVFFILTLGFINPDSGIFLPYYFLHNIFPFSFIDEPSRFFVIFYLFLTAGVVLQLRQMYKNNRKTLVFFIFIAMLIVLERLPLNYWLSPTFANDPFVRVVKEEKSTAVLDIPVSYYNTAYDVFPYIYKKKIVSGNFQWFADTADTKFFIENNGLKRFMCGNEFDINSQTNIENGQLVQTLKNYDIRTIVVHKNDSKDGAKFYFPECAGARMQTSLLLPQLLMPNPTRDIKVLSLFFPATLLFGDTITFSSAGTFFINGFHAYPIDWLPLHIYFDGLEIPMNQNWTDRGNKNATLDPYLKIIVQKGSKLRFKFDKNHNQDYSFINLWYKYETQDKTEQIDSAGQITKIYEDDDAAVFQIR